MDGYEVFGTWVSNWTGLDDDNYMSVQSLASSFMLNKWMLSNMYINFPVLVSNLLQHVLLVVELCVIQINSTMLKRS